MDFRRKVGNSFVIERPIDDVDRSIEAESMFIAQHFIDGISQPQIVACASLYYPGGEEPIDLGEVIDESDIPPEYVDKDRVNLRENVRASERAYLEFGSVLVDPDFEGLGLATAIAAMALLVPLISHDDKLDFFAVVDPKNEAPRSLLNSIGFRTWSEPSPPGKVKANKDYFIFSAPTESTPLSDELQTLTKNLLNGGYLIEKFSRKPNGDKGAPVGPPFQVRFDLPLLSTDSGARVRSLLS
ncbi:GNAT family N-acetyltransferase [Maricaulaceae bacterium NA33B04]|nr:GNAT family N-acetyltransferase [Maricaulaceae bacterium NA33B04]